MQKWNFILAKYIYDFFKNFESERQLFESERQLFESERQLFENFR